MSEKPKIETIPLHICQLIPMRDGSAAIILGENHREDTRHFLMCIGPLEACAIAMPLQRETAPRPMTHDLVMSILTGLDMKLTRAVIVDLQDQTFIGTATIRSNTRDPVTGEIRELSIDCRPSDLIAVALRAGVTIEIAPHVLDAVGEPSLQALCDSLGIPLMKTSPEELDDEDEEWKKGIPPA